MGALRRLSFARTRTRALGPWLAACALALMSGLAPAPVHADPAPETNGRTDIYEWQRTERAISKLGLTVAEAPEGKRIAWIRIVVNDVFAADELAPLWLNWFHGTTREFVVRRELLFEQGGRYHEPRIEETMRNLRNMGIFALVRIVPIATSEPDAVGVLVFTRDLWSLRLETAFNISSQINSLGLRLTELNLFGRNKQVSLDYELLPKTYSFFASFYARRVQNSRVTLTTGAGPIFNRARNRVEGSMWELQTGEPFYYLKQRRAYLLSATYTDQVVRRTSNGVTGIYQSTPGGPAANAVFRQRTPAVNLWGYLRRGTAFKQTFGLGWDYRQTQANPTAETDLPAGLRAAFAQDVMPRQRREIGPAASYQIFMPKFVTFTNLGTFGKSENVQVGPTAAVSVRAPLGAFGSNSDSWVMQGNFGFVLAPGGGLIELSLGGRARYERREIVDQLGTALLRGATPVLGWVRLVARSTLEVRRRDTARTFVTLGSDSGLRGYRSQAFYGYGCDRWLANFEARTLPLRFHALHVGGVAFFDVGSVFNQFSDMRAYYAMGVGIRFLFAQLSRYPFSLDAGFSGDPDFRFVPSFTSDQVVPLTATEDAL
jgi:hypothetical protein